MARLTKVPAVPLDASGIDWTLPLAAGLETPSSLSPSFTLGAATGRGAACATGVGEGVFEEMAMLMIGNFLD